MKRARHPHDVSATLLYVAFAAVVGAFFASNFFVLRASSDIGTLAESITSNAAPSIEALASVRRSVLETELTLSHFVHEGDPDGELLRSLNQALARTELATSDYLARAAFSGEQPAKLSVHEGWLEFEGQVTRIRDLVLSGRRDEASRAFAFAIEPIRGQLLDQVGRAIELNSSRGGELAAEIREIRERTVRLATVLNVTCGLLALGVVWLLQREVAHRRALRIAHTEQLENRSAELEQFAGRVAHDIRNPLTGAKIAAELLARRYPDDSSRGVVERLKRSLTRANAITDALLGFARAGARPDPGARADVRALASSYLDEVQEETQRLGIDLQVEPIPPVLAASSEGVYLSLLSNLVRNAVKYIGPREPRRISVRVLDGPRRGVLRTEVEDTGPGIAPELLSSLFDPYVRGKTGPVEGLGLGLSTVKKLAEAHGGSAGVESTLGQGSTFWFELPRAGSSAAEPAIPAEPSVAALH